GLHVQTSIAQQVNLVNAAGLTLNWWDGEAGPKNDGAVNGGDLGWQSGRGNDNWTEASGSLNAPFTDGAFAIFAGRPGTVAVDNGLGAVAASGMQFAVDGYLVEGEALTLVGDAAVVRVGDGTAAGAGMTATVAAEIRGAAQLVKADLGTLVLSAANSHAGGTAIRGGVLEIASDASLGAAAGGLGFDGGTLRVTGNTAIGRATTLAAGGGTFETADGVTLTQRSGITGRGGLGKAGAGTLVLLGENAFTGGTTISGGTLRIGDGGTAGSLAGDVRNDGALVFDRAGRLDFDGAISGRGTVLQAGTGTTRLGGAGRHSGATTIAAGTLEAAAAGVLSPASAHLVAAAGALDLADFDQRVARLENAGRVSLGHAAGTRLTVAGDYAGRGGLLHFSTELGGDGSPTDLLLIEGDTSGTGIVEVVNAGGMGGQTVEGIKIIDVEGASEASFTLAGNTVIDGQPVVIGGAYAYSLWKNGITDPADGDWYLRSQPTFQPGPPLVQPGVPAYEAYPQVLLALSGLPTMQERIGNRRWQEAGASGGLTEDRRAWARIEGSRSRIEPDSELVDDARYDLDVWKLQLGIDRPVRETEGGLLVAGLTAGYGTVAADISSASAGDGSIATTGYGFGGSLTWFGNDDLYLDGQAQAMWFDSDLASDEVDDDLESGNRGFGYALGVEAGRRVAVRPGWAVTPQAQLVYASVAFDDFEDTFGVEVESGDGATLPVRLGVSIDRQAGGRDAGGEGRRTHVYGIANLYHDLIGETKLTVGGTGLTNRPD
ncbi:autotransporter outer membrane beta-barrel domain-containing protein, partial [Amaricoccus sp.]|uniref:autotransporter family protein n=1 Tax=Amaricoccus sp. TaxID=1872485 RepID=UPI002609DE5F